MYGCHLHVGEVRDSNRTEVWDPDGLSFAKATLVTNTKVLLTLLGTSLFAGCDGSQIDETGEDPGTSEAVTGYATVIYQVWGTDSDPQYADGLDANGQPLTGTHATYNPTPNLQTILNSTSPQLVVLKPLTAGAVLHVRAPLSVHGATHLQGGLTAIAPVTDISQVTGTRSGYAVRLSGDNLSGLPYRNNYVLTLSGQDVSVLNLYFEGHLGAAAISANGASNLIVRHIAVAGGWQGVMAVQNGAGVTISDVYADVLADPNQPANQVATGSSFGIWVKLVSTLLIEYCNTRADAYYNFGPPHSVGGPKVFSHVALYSVHTATIRHNNWYKSNDNALFATCVSNGAQHMTDCKLGGASAANRTTDLTLWDNRFQLARQSFFDIDHSDRVQILSNTLDHSDGSGVSLSDSTYATVRYNHIGAACENLSDKLMTFYEGYIGGVGFQTGSRDSQVLDNTIDVPRCPYAAVDVYTVYPDEYGEVMRVNYDRNRWNAQTAFLGDTKPGRNTQGTNTHL